MDGSTRDLDLLNACQSSRVSMFLWAAVCVYD